jgi:hypothetical protein
VVVGLKGDLVQIDAAPVAQQLKQLSPLDSRSVPAPTATLACSSLRAGSRTPRVGRRAVRRPPKAREGAARISEWAEKKTAVKTAA